MSDKENTNRFRPLRSLTRIIIGGVVLGAETLTERLQRWEHPEGTEPAAGSGAEVPPSEAETPEGQPAAAETDSQSVDPLPEQLPPPHRVEHVPPKSSSAEVSQVGYALVGLLFESQETLGRWWDLSARAGKLAARAADPLIKPLTKLPNPARKPVDRLAERGQSKVEQWVSRGRAETEQGVQITQTAVTETMDETITYMAQNPALEELVQQQSLSLAQQMLLQIRQMSLSADYFFEGAIRYLLHRPPRNLLPPPSSAVQTQAAWRVRDMRNEDADG